MFVLILVQIYTIRTISGQLYSIKLHKVCNEHIDKAAVYSVYNGFLE